jgi:pyruvate carboxylase
MRVVCHAEELEEAFKRCQSEARAAFGNSDVYVERFMPAARHVEVQILGGDRSGKVTHLWSENAPFSDGIRN